MSKSKSKTINNPWNKKNPKTLTNKKRKKNKLKTKSNIKGPMVDRITNSKTITLFIISNTMINKTWEKVNKMPKDQAKGKKVLASLYILSGNNSCRKS